MALITLVLLIPENSRADLAFHMLRAFPLSMCPGGGLVQGDDAYFYGVTAHGGMHDGGTLYRLGTDGSLHILHHFEHLENSTDANAAGSLPLGTLVKGKDGTLYGITNGGGVNKNGTIFSYQPSTGLFSTLHHFDYRAGAGNRNLTKGPNGALYGTCAYGGSKAGGTIFRLSKDGTFTILHEFFHDTQNPNYVYAERHEPYEPNSIWVGEDEVIYGTTLMGGPVRGRFTNGTAFRLDPDGTFALLHEFTVDCDHPRIFLQTGGNLYGAGGTSYDSMVFKMSFTGEITPVKVFQTFPTPGLLAELILGTDGALYGSNYYGGELGAGFLYRVTLDGDYGVLYNYPRELSGFPRTGLIEGIDGALYGATNAPEPSTVLDSSDEAPQSTVTSMANADSNSDPNRVRAAIQAPRSSKRNGAFRISIRPNMPDNRAPIVRSEVITVRRIGTTKISVLRNDKDPDKDPLRIKSLSGVPEGLTANFDSSINQLVLSTSVVPIQTAVIRYTVTDETNDSVGNVVIRPAFSGTYGWKSDAGARLRLTLTAKGAITGYFKVNGETHKLRASVGLDDTISGAINASRHTEVHANLKVAGAPYQVSGTLTLNGTNYEITAQQRAR